MPGGPTSVTSRASGFRSSSRKRPISASRPISEVAGKGRPPELPAPAEGVCRTATEDGATGRAAVGTMGEARERNSRRASGRSSGGTPSSVSNRPASCCDGRCLPASILRTVSGEQPTRSASASCVRSSCLRRAFSHRPVELESLTYKKLHPPLLAPLILPFILPLPPSAVIGYLL